MAPADPTRHGMRLLTKRFIGGLSAALKG